MKFQQTNLDGNFIINLEKKEDERGFFARYFCEKEFKKKKLNTNWVQINNSFTKDKGTLRGLHFQNPPHAEVKLIRCIKGVIYDVVVDLRKNSKTFGKWFGSYLSEKNRTMMYVPEDFAHGFISLTKNTEIIYLISNFYQPTAERTLVWNDPDVNIEWPEKPKVISKKDRSGCLIKNIIF